MRGCPCNRYAKSQQAFTSSLCIALPTPRCADSSLVCADPRQACFFGSTGSP